MVERNKCGQLLRGIAARALLKVLSSAEMQEISERTLELKMPDIIKACEPAFLHSVELHMAPDGAGETYDIFGALNDRKHDYGTKEFRLIDLVKSEFEGYGVTDTVLIGSEEQVDGFIHELEECLDYVRKALATAKRKA